MSEFKGGRGNKAPYQTTHIRVPEPLKPEVEAAIADFKHKLATGQLVLNGNQIFTQISIPAQADDRLEKLKAIITKYEAELTSDRISQPRWKNVYKLVNEIKEVLE